MSLTIASRSLVTSVKKNQRGEAHNVHLSFTHVGSLFHHCNHAPRIGFHLVIETEVTGIRRYRLRFVPLGIFALSSPFPHLVHFVSLASDSYHSRRERMTRWRRDSNVRSQGWSLCWWSSLHCVNLVSFSVSTRYTHPLTSFGPLRGVYGDESNRSSDVVSYEGIRAQSLPFLCSYFSHPVLVTRITLVS